jgi:hypothetical protein
MLINYFNYLVNSQIINHIDSQNVLFGLSIIYLFT